MSDNNLYRKRQLRLTSGFLLTTALFSINGHAAGFDEAVNHYLDGFAACQDANKALQAGQYDKARSKFAEYQRYFKEAQAIDANITHSKERNMAGNIQICERVNRDIANSAGAPIMEKALSQCKSAESALAAEKPEDARAMLDEFRKLRDEALGISPGLKDIFSIKNQLGKCDRFENKIGRVAAKQEAAEAAIAGVKTASTNYANTCQEAAAALKDGNSSEQALRAVNAKLASAAALKKTATGNADIKALFEKNPDHPENTAIAANIKTGDTCVAEVQSQLAKRAAEIATMKKAVAQYESQATGFANTCAEASRMASGQATEANHAAAGKRLQDATTQGKILEQKIAADVQFQKAAEQGLTDNIRKKIATGKECLSGTNTQLAQLLTAVKNKKAEAEAGKLAEQKAKQEAEARALADAQARKQAEEKAVADARAAETRAAEEKAALEAKQKAEAADSTLGKAAGAAGAAASAVVAAITPDTKPETATAQAAKGFGKIEGKITLTGNTPEFAVFYLLDGSKAPTSADAELRGPGFEKPVYVVNPGARIDVRNADNTMRKMSVVDDYGGYKGPILMVNPRQKKSFTAGWPLNRAVLIKSEKPTQSPAWIVTVAGGNYTMLPGSGGSFSHTGKPGESAALVMPGHDPVALTFDGQGNARADITQNGKKVGEISIKGS